MSDHEKPRLYLVATSHLDSQWRWTIQTTIRHFLKRTLLDNFARFREFPGYVLSFEGAFRYQLLEEYYPREFQKLVGFAGDRRWRPAGAMLDAPDTNIPSPESLIRHILYGNDYFENKFGRRCVDIFLPDCFGFPWSLPTIAAHCGLAGFSSSKLIKWMSPAKVPFDIGLWEGPDGSRIVAVLDPGGYGEPLREDLSRSRTWLERLEAKRRATGLAIGYKYFGLGDRGGAPDPTSLDFLERSLTGDGDIDVVHAGSDQLFRDISEQDRSRLPVHRGDLLLPTHGTGCWTSQAVVKKWNRRCELLAEAAERAALAADWLRAQKYPHAELRREWTRFLWHQMHDDLTGTSSPEAYRFTWNDLVLAQNRFSTLLRSSVASVARGLDTRSAGIPIVVFNALGFEREELVDAWVHFDAEPPASVQVGGCTGAVPCQVLEHEGNSIRLLFPATVPSVGFAVYQVLPADPADPAPETLSTGSEVEVTANTLENLNYRLEVNDDGAVTSLYDKKLDREWLSEPMDIVLLPDNSARWPAWELRYEDLCRPTSPIPGPARIRIAEQGPVRATLEIDRTVGATKLRQRLSLSAGDPGSRVEVDHDIDWQSRGSLLKAVFPMALNRAAATYDMGLGSVQREPNRREQYEVPAHEWADISNSECGVSILSRDKYGWDRPSASTLRLSLLRSPSALRRFAHQAVQDLGRHRFSYALESHGGSAANVPARAASFNQPLFAFQAGRHPGALGRRFSLLAVEGEHTLLMALKKAEHSDRWMARVRETKGDSSQPSRVSLAAAGPFLEAEQVDGCEQAQSSQPARSPRSPITLTDGRLNFELPAFAPRSFLLQPGRAEHSVPTLDQERIELAFNTPATSLHGQRGPDFDRRGRSIPAELFPRRIQIEGLSFLLGSNAPGARNALSCKGQELVLPEGDFDRFSFLAASTSPTGTTMAFRSQAVPDVHVPYYSGFVGQWKRFSGRVGFLLRRWQPGFVERTPVAWTGSHLHDRKGRDQVYTYCYFFFLEVPVPPGSSSLRLPAAPEVKLFGATVSRSGDFALVPAAHFYD